MLRLESILMPPELVGDGQPFTISIDLIDEDPNQPRSEFEPEALRELAETIARRGVRQPISVRRHPTDSHRWMLNFGARRVRASRLAGKAEIPAFIDEAVDSYDQVIENEQRERIKPLDLAMFMKRRMMLGETQSQIASLLGKSQPYIATVGALIDAPDWLMNVYRSGQCRGIAELYQLRRLHEKWPEQVDRWLRESGHVSRGQLMKFADVLASPPRNRLKATRARMSSAPPNQRPATINTPGKVDGAKGKKQHPPHFGLMATLENDLVEIMLKPAQPSAESLWVRRGGQLIAAAARSLVLVGFRQMADEPVEQSDGG